MWRYCKSLGYDDGAVKAKKSKIIDELEAGMFQQAEIEVEQVRDAPSRPGVPFRQGGDEKDGGVIRAPVHTQSRAHTNASPGLAKLWQDSVEMITRGKS